MKNLSSITITNYFLVNKLKLLFIKIIEMILII